MLGTAESAVTIAMAPTLQAAGIPNITSGFDLVLIARPGLVSATLEETRQALLTLLQRAQILTPLNES